MTDTATLRAPRIKKTESLMRGYGQMSSGTRAWNKAKPRLVRTVTVMLAVSLAAVTLAVIQPAQEAKALDGSQFNPGYIIDDSNFYNANAMSQPQIQAFLEAKEPGTCGPNSCLKLYRMNTPDRAQYYSDSSGKVECQAYRGAANELASTIIFRIQQACGISAKVILVVLQKERGIVSKTSPIAADFRVAMGFGCPDTAPCDTMYYGFFNQIRKAAEQFKRYKVAPGDFRYRAGRVNSIQYSPDATCGSAQVYIANQATAGLYDYTPYTPNAASLANLRGTVLTGRPACGAYGNRNFWVYYNDWFGSPSGNPMGKLGVTSVSNNAVNVSGWAIDPDVPTWAATVRIRGAGWSQTLSADKNSPDSAAAFPGAGTAHGFSATLPASVGTQSVCIDALNYGLGGDVTLGCSTVTVPTQVVVSRTSGTDRYNTAVAISQKNFAPNVATVYVASGENFPDALSIVPVAAHQKAPLLLTTSAAVPPAVLAELARLKPAKIVTVGGTSAISAAAVSKLQAIAPVERIDGIDRFQTSLNAGEALGALHSGRAYLATGSTFPDAISAAAAAGFQNAPLILVDGSTGTVPATIADALARWGVTQVTVIGGTSAISDRFSSAVEALPNVSVSRLSGVDRYQTSIAVNSSVFGTATSAYVATAIDYPDGLTGGSVAGAKGIPLYLASNSCVPREAISRFTQAHLTTMMLLGGAEALGDGVARLAPC